MGGAEQGDWLVWSSRKWEWARGLGSQISSSSREQEVGTSKPEAWMMFSLLHLFPHPQALTIGYLLALTICHFHPGAWVTLNSS